MKRTCMVILLSCLLASPLAAEESTLAPAWSLARPDGSPFSFESTARNRPAVLLFWATWCPYCRKLMPEIQRLREDYAAEALDIFAINVWEDDDPVAYMRELGFSYDLMLEGDAVADAYGVRGTPGLVVVAPGGAILYTRVSGTEPADVGKHIVAALNTLAVAPIKR